MMTACAFAALAAVTAGWENICADRIEYPETEKIWQADFSRSGDFRWELREGAEAKVEIGPDGIRISKTNDRGYVVVTAKPFPVPKGAEVRFTADQKVPDADVNYSSNALRYYGRKENLAICSAAERKNFWSGGLHTMRGMPCTAPGMLYRKYGQCIAEDDVLTPVIIVSGAASESVWTRWFAEDALAAQDEWINNRENTPDPDRVGDRIDEAEFDRMIAADTDHVATISRIDGVSRLVVDGKIEAPSVYKARHRIMYVEKDKWESFSGKPLDGSAVKIMIKAVDPRSCCDPDGGNVDVKKMVAQMKSAMRAAPKSLFIMAVGGQTPIDFVKKYHPEEAWINEKGEPVMGLGGSCMVGYLGSTKEQFQRDARPWPSPSSRVWREWVKKNVRDLVAELKAQGLSKRIVGMHIYGFHDGQYSVPYTDHSKPAQGEYRRMIAEPGCISTNYAFCMKQAAFRAQEEFIREFKRAIGKPAIGVMWCESPFQGARNASLDLTSFVNSDAMDVVVCQPNYRERLPAFPTVSAIPTDSLHLHGKMFWNEYDYRTYAPVRTGDSAVSLKSLGTAADFPMWQTMYRKVAGEANATRMGYWFYDMSGGWYYTPAIAADIRHHVREEELLSQMKPSPWRPDVAIVLDEVQILQEGENPLLRITQADENIYAASCRLFGTSGVPHERFLADDVLRHPEILDGKKMVVIAFFRRIDDKRAALLRRLAAQGTTLVFLSETGVRGGAEESKFDVVFKSGGAFGHQVVAVPGFNENVESIMDVYSMRERTKHITTPQRCSVKETPGVKVLARYEDDKLPALAVREDADCRRVYVCEPGGLTSGLMNRFAREAGAYVPVPRTGLQVDMNGDFISVHCLRPGTYDFKLPFDCEVLNLKTYAFEKPEGRILKLNLTAGETCRFWIGNESGAAEWSRHVPELRRLSDFPSEKPPALRRYPAPGQAASAKICGPFRWKSVRGFGRRMRMCNSGIFNVEGTKGISLHDGGTIYAHVFFQESSTPPGKPRKYDGICFKRDEFLLGRNLDGIYFNMFLDGKWSVKAPLPKFSIGKWVDIAVTVTKGPERYDIVYYVDGVEVQRANAAFGAQIPPGARTDLQIGTCWGTEWLFGGKLDKLFIYDRPLSAEEVKGLSGAE